MRERVDAVVVVFTPGEFRVLAAALEVADAAAQMNDMSGYDAQARAEIRLLLERCRAGGSVSAGNDGYCVTVT